MSAAANPHSDEDDRFLRYAGPNGESHDITTDRSLQVLHGSQPKSGADYDVIVIGGGFAGVTAARECRKSGLKTLLLEGRNRFGGRTFTAMVHGEPTEMGGTWVHWFQPHVWAEIMRYGLSLVETPGATAPKMVVRTSGNSIETIETASEWAKIEAAVAAYMGPSRELFSKSHNPFASASISEFDDLSGADRLATLSDMEPLYRDVIDAFMSTCGANRQSNIAWIEMVRWYALSGHNLTDMNDAVCRYRFKEGTSALISAMLRDGVPDTLLSTPVARVEQGESGVTVTTKGGGKFTSKVVVSAVPLNVLKDIDWSPALIESKREASVERHAGSCAKVHVVLEGDVGNIACFAPSQFGLTWLFTEHASADRTHLVGFGPSSDLLDGDFRSQIEEATRQFMPGAKVLEVFGYQWVGDEYSQSTWCVLRPGQYGRHLAALQAQQGRVIFASGDWANGWRGFIDGAIEQGLRAGRLAGEVVAAAK
ncbi:MAG: flavin monoamine oxidase family protein [Pseudorhodoplanes sp.]